MPTGTTVTSAASDGPRHEQVEVSETGEGGTLVFAMLGWPGWTATYDGKSVPVGRNAVGLLTVDAPAELLRDPRAHLPPAWAQGRAWPLQRSAWSAPSRSAGSAVVDAATVWTRTT